MKINIYTLLIIGFFLISLVSDAIAVFFESFNRINLFLKGGFVLVFLSLLLFKKRNNVNFIVLLIAPFLVFMIGVMLNRMVHSNPYQFISYIETLIWILKNLSIFIFFYFFIEFIEDNRNLRIVNKFIFLVISIYLSTLILGAAFSIETLRTYDGGFRAGFKGVIPAQNEATVFLIFSLFLISTFKHSVAKSLLLLLNFISLLLLGTKAAIFSIAIILLILLSVKYGIKKSAVYTMGLVAILGATIAVMYNNIVKFNEVVNASWQYFQYRIDAGMDLWTLLLSGRNDKLLRVVDDILNHSPFAFFIGGHPISTYYIELDFFDLITVWGVLGGVVYVFLLKQIFYKSHAKIYFWFFVLIAMTGGHATYSVLAAPYIAMFLVNTRQIATSDIRKREPVF